MNEDNKDMDAGLYSQRGLGPLDYFKWLEICVKGPSSYRRIPICTVKHVK